MASSSIWWHCICIACQRVLTTNATGLYLSSYGLTLVCLSHQYYSTVLHSTVGSNLKVSTTQQPRLTVILSSYCSKLIAGSICATLKDFSIVWIGQDSCYRSLYLIECSLIDLIPEVGHTLVPLIWLLWSDLTQGESGKQSFRLAQWSQ